MLIQLILFYFSVRAKCGKLNLLLWKSHCPWLPAQSVWKIFVLEWVRVPPCAFEWAVAHLRQNIEAGELFFRQNLNFNFAAQHINRRHEPVGRADFFAADHDFFGNKSVRADIFCTLFYFVGSYSNFTFNLERLIKKSIDLAAYMLVLTVQKISAGIENIAQRIWIGSFNREQFFGKLFSYFI